MAQNLEMAINGMDLTDVFPQNASSGRAAIFMLWRTAMREPIS